MAGGQGGGHIGCSGLCSSWREREREIDPINYIHLNEQ